MKEHVLLTPKQFKEIRLRLKMTQKELGDFLGFKRRMITRWECGETPIRPIVGDYLTLYIEHHRRRYRQ